MTSSITGAEFGDDLEAVGLADGNGAHTRRNDSGGEAVEHGGKRRLRRYGVGGGAERDGDRVGQDASGPRPAASAAEAVVRPCRQDGGEEGAALRGRFQVAFARGLEGGAELGNGPQAVVVAGFGRPPRREEEDGIVAAGAVAENVREPGGKRRPVGDAAVFDRPFQPVAVGVAADRKGGRQPGEQLAQRVRRAGQRMPQPSSRSSCPRAAVS